MKYFSMLDDPYIGFGGVAETSFRRSAALWNEAGIPTTVLSIADVPEFPVVVDKLRASGIVGETPILNLYASLAKTSVVDRVAPYLATPRRTVSVPEPAIEELEVDLEHAYAKVTEGRGPDEISHYFDTEGYRFLAIEKRNATTKKGLVSLFDTSTGKAVFQGRSAGLIEGWVDSLIGDDSATLIFDDIRFAKVLREYTKPGVVKIMIQHSSHLQRPDEEGTLAAVRKAHLDIFRSLGSFDSIVCLTSRHAEELASRIDPMTRVDAIPYVVPVPDVTVDEERSSKEVLAFLEHNADSRADFVIRAFAKAYHDGDVDNLTIVGDPRSGEHFWNAMDVAEQNEVKEVVKFLPYEPMNLEKLWSAGVAVFAKSYDGSGSTIVEAMSRGAIPVAVDARYAPGAVIEDGINGYLVAGDDPEKFAEAISKAARRDVNDRMRRIARRDAQKYGPATIAARWSRLFGKLEAGIAERDRLHPLKPTVESMTLTEAGVHFSLGLDVEAFTGIELELVIESYDSLQRVAVDRTGYSMGPRVGFTVPSDYKRRLPDEILGAWLHVRGGGVSLRHRVLWPKGWGKAGLSITGTGQVAL